MIVKRFYRWIKNRIKIIIWRCKKQIPVFIPTLQGELLKGRVAVITGGTKGIGFEIAKAFLNNGASVLITGRNKEQLETSCVKLCKLAKPGEKALCLQMDNTEVQNFSEKFAEILEKFNGRQPDVLVNNAGCNVHKTFSNFTEEDFDLIMNTNLKSAFFLSRIFSDYMRKNKIKGNILNITSSSALRPGISPYTLSKWGLHSLTLGLAKLLAKDGITVNAIAPGPTFTSMHVSTIHTTGGGAGRILCTDKAYGNSRRNCKFGGHPRE